MEGLLYFLPAILFLGIITSYEDIKFGKIRNKWVVSMLVYSIIIYALLISDYFLKGGIDGNYVIELITNFCFAMVIGFGLWYFKIWTAGDGKLFIAYSALVPLSVYKYGYEKWIPSITLLMNVFIIGLVFMLIIIIYKSKLKDIKNVFWSFLKKFFEPKKLLETVIRLFAIYWIVGMLLLLVGLGSSYILKMGLTISLMYILSKKFGRKSLYVMLAVVFVRLFVDESIYSVDFVKNFVILIIVWKLIRGFIMGGVSDLGRGLFTKEIGVEMLKPGMLLSEIIHRKRKISQEELKVLRKQKNVEIMKNKGVYYIKKIKSGFDLGNFIDEEAEGLTKEQIDKIKEAGISKMKVAQTIPFAPFMFLGVILTLMAKGNILILIKLLF